ncbi:hypothetical protein PGTUg99_027335 [Puccinia graminis f. sp. tritici]|uniref:Uncharacterized protein n=1 Tax=Puccinia graminis f. sp. tritici TaxID=56615 RepID=A0A5B0SQD0_PUCGR|nr:hypothetical protein PGTUg99_027335 [Puccinia graminis f. sp. tritici]
MPVTGTGHIRPSLALKKTNQNGKESRLFGGLAQARRLTHRSLVGILPTSPYKYAAIVSSPPLLHTPAPQPAHHAGLRLIHLIARDDLHTSNDYSELRLYSPPLSGTSYLSYSVASNAPNSHSLQLASLALSYVNKLCRSTMSMLLHADEGIHDSMVPSDYIPAAAFPVSIYVVARHGSSSFLLHPTLVHVSRTT